MTLFMTYSPMAEVCDGFGGMYHSGSVIQLVVGRTRRMGSFILP